MTMAKSADLERLARDLERLSREHRSVLKDEAATTVERLGTGAEAVVRKTYRNLGTRWLQSFGRRARAEREFTNLRAVEAIGVPCTAAVAWSAKRRLGCVDQSTLVTRFVERSRTLKQVLAESQRGPAWRTRAGLAAAMGRLVARLHRGGLVWGTAMPRNVLVVGDAAAAELAVCDTPAALRIGRPVLATWLGEIDVFAAAMSTSRRKDFSTTERWRWLVAYTDGDRETARRLWRRLSRRPDFVHDARRAIATAWFGYVRPARVSPTPP